ncbi:MAG: amylo-alpha-1,6-glucosidase [Alistipes finegoldii]
MWASSEHVPLTWTNSVIDGRPVTPRNGYQVEVNALWYNAVRYTLRLAGEHGDKKFVKARGSAARKDRGGVRRAVPPAGRLSGRTTSAARALLRDIRPNMILATRTSLQGCSDEQGPAGSESAPCASTS